MGHQYKNHHRNRNKIIVANFLALCATFFSLLLANVARAAEMPSSWQNGFQAVYKELEKNLRPANSWLPLRHARPAPKFDAVYLWDSAFIALVWLDRDPAVSRDILRSVLFAQQSDGRVPHMNSWHGMSKWTQPPILSWAIAKAVKRTGDTSFASETYVKLKAYHAYMLRTRSFPASVESSAEYQISGFFWLHPYEAGIDNSPRFGSRDEARFVDTTKIEAVDLAVYMAVDAESLAELADAIAINQNNLNEAQKLHEEAAGFRAEATAINQYIQRSLWDRASGYFYDREHTTGSPVRINTIASVLPLFSGAANDEQAAALVAHIKNPDEFNTPIPLPTVARNDAQFEKDCWRGPVWVNTAYLVINGLRRYGQLNLAHDLSARLVDGIFRTFDATGKFVEFYDPERFDFKKLSRKRGTGLWDFFSDSKDPNKFLEHLIAKQFYLGQKPVEHFVGWTGLINTMALEEFAPSP